MVGRAIIVRRHTRGLCQAPNFAERAPPVSFLLRGGKANYFPRRGGVPTRVTLRVFPRSLAQPQRDEIISHRRNPESGGQRRSAPAPPNKTRKRRRPQNLYNVVEGSRVPRRCITSRLRTCVKKKKRKTNFGGVEAQIKQRKSLAFGAFAICPRY